MTLMGIVSLTLNRSLPFLIAVLFTRPAIALGLGELVVQSPLGKPLRASIAVRDAPPDIQPDCFSLKNGNDAALPGVPEARIRLETRGANTTLFITTAQIVNEPVFLITVSAVCADRLQRDYVVLLDPPSVTPSDTAVAEALPPRADPEGDVRQLTQRSPTQYARARTRPTQLVAASTSHQSDKKPASAPRAQPRTENAKLVLSGGRYRPDKLVDTAIVRNTSKPMADASPAAGAMSPTELSDEHTALKHRIAYLQTQLLALQQRNDELEAARHVQVKAPAPAPVAAGQAVSRWTQFLIVMGILSLGAALFFGLRAYPRRSSARRVDVFVSLPPGGVDGPHVYPAASAIAPEALRTAPAARGTAKPESTDPNMFAHAISTRGTEVNEDILDQAEVYVAHGHASLAIHMLQEYVRNTPTESPVPWLLLLDLLAREGPEAEYRATCIACKKHYNINLSIPAQNAGTDGAGLEAYPHVVAHLQHLWGCREAVAFLADLVYDRRNGTRQGFEPGAYREIILLRSIAEEAGYGQRVSPPFKPAACEASGMALEPAAAAQTDKPEPDPLPTEKLLDLTEWPLTREPPGTLTELQQRVREAPTVSPIPWLQLLDLLARDNLQAAFLAARTECQSLFNVNLTDSVATNLFPAQASLEAYPHVVEPLQAVWHTPDVEYFLSELIYDQRGGIRQGFDLDAYREILLLHALVESET